MAFTLEGFEVYNTEYDDRGIDFVIRNSLGKFYSVQVKATDENSNPFIRKEKFQSSDDFMLCAVRLVENKPPSLYLALGVDWTKDTECLHFNPEGGASGPYYEMRFSNKYLDELSQHEFQIYIEKIRN